MKLGYLYLLKTEQWISHFQDFRWLVSGEERYVTTQITAAKETIFAFRISILLSRIGSFSRLVAP